MHAFDYATPQSVADAVVLLNEHGKNALVLAGGTDLLVHLRAGALQPDLIVDGKSVPELSELSYSPEFGLTLGAAVPCYEIYQNAEVAAAYPGLIDAVALIGGIQIQGRASVGGNLCNGTPSADTIPALIAHNVTCKIAGPGGSREVAVEDFCTGPATTFPQAVSACCSATRLKSGAKQPTPAMTCFYAATPMAARSACPAASRSPSTPTAPAGSAKASGR